MNQTIEFNNILTFRGYFFNSRYIFGSIKETEKADSTRTRVYVYYTNVPATISLPASTVTQTWLFVTSVDIDDVKAKLAYNKLADMTPEELEQSHVDAWQSNWDDGMVMVEGDLEVMKVTVCHTCRIELMCAIKAIGKQG